APTTGGVVAVEADTGKEVWRYGNVPAAGGRGGGGARGGGGRGAAGPAPGAGATPPAAATPNPNPATPQAAATAPIGNPYNRGVAYWPGDGTIPARIFFTSLRHLSALRVSDGQLDTTFGQGGSITY